MKKIKVLHVIKVMNRAGAETMIMNIYRNIDRTKIQFDFLCLSEKNGDYEKEIKQLGGNVYKIPEPKKQGRFKNFYSIYRVMKENKYDVVHSHIMFYNGFINLIARIAKIKTRISHSHNSYDIKIETMIRKIYMTITRAMINRFSNIKIACGEEAGKYLYGKNQKFIILKNAIDLDNYLNVTKEEVDKLKKELRIGEKELIIGNVGRFDKVKNQDFFIDLAKEFIVRKENNFKIILVGQGERFELIKNKIKEEKLEQFFVMTGLRQDIPVIMNLFDIFVMPSLYEGFPLVVVEALAGNNICFLSDQIPKETEVIKSRVKFFSLNINKNELIENIYYEIKNKEDINIEQKLNDAGFSIKKMTKQISEIYENKV